jgi:hypothetical protein
MSDLSKKEFFKNKNLKPNFTSGFTSAKQAAKK